LATIVVIRHIGQTKYTTKDLDDLDVGDISTDHLKSAMDDLIELIISFSQKNTMENDVIAKSKEFVEHIINEKSKVAK
jgi:hypothetical protein